MNTYRIIYMPDTSLSPETVRAHRIFTASDGYIRFLRSDNQEVYTLVARHVISVRWLEATTQEPDPEPSDEILTELERQRARFAEQDEVSRQRIPERRPPGPISRT